MFSRRIVGWALSDSVRTSSAAATGPQPGDREVLSKLPELVHYSDHGSQHLSIVYSEFLAYHGIAASTGSKSDCYDNVLAENLNGSYKSELIYTRTGSDVVDLGIATFEWVNWWDSARLHQSLGYRTPMEIESEF